jgi:chromosome segregation ATPase
MKQISRRLILVCIALSTLCGTSVLAQSAGGNTPQKALSPSVAASIAVIESAIADKEAELSLRQNELDQSRQMEKTSFEELGNRSNKLSSSSLSIESYPEIVKTLQTQRIELMIKEAGISGRLKNLTSLYLKDLDEKKKAATPLAQKLEEILKLQKAELDLTDKLIAKGTRSQSERTRAQTAVLETEIRLEKIRQEATKSETTKEYREFFTNRGEVRAQLAKIEELLGTVSKQRDNVDQVRKLKKEWEFAIADSMEQNQMLRNLQLEIAALRMRITQLRSGANSAGAEF